ncbi:MAG: alpha/beta fold hydrolase [Betaproteobacteria bacterium]|nr:MAG: alpha/beta fold hydrolase [Betaproteobacteria bacterium]
MNAPRVELSSEVAQVRLRALDGYELGAALYVPHTGQPPRRVAVLHCGAGIPAARYRRFARFLAEAGIPVLTYDYRGIGHSRPDGLRGFRAAIEDWAEYDCGGAIAWLRERYPEVPILGIAHSIGALIIGGAHNSSQQSRLVLIGGHTGYYGDYLAKYRLPMTAVWHGLMPLLTLMLGYFPARRLGLGEDLPAKVALQWAGRRSPELRPTGTEPGFERVQMLLDRCAALQRPALLVSISDDAFATAAGAKRLLSYYPRLFPLEHLVFTPADAGVARVGHFGFFGRKAGAALWPRLVMRLEQSAS